MVESGEVRFVLVGSGGGPGGGPGGQGIPGAGSNQAIPVGGPGQGVPGAASNQGTVGGVPGQGIPGGGQGTLGGGPGQGAPGGGDSEVSAERTTWVEESCTVVDSLSASSGVLWDCAG